MDTDLFTENTPMLPSLFQTDTLPSPPPCAVSQKMTIPHSGKLPTVTHVLYFQTAYKMMSRQCIVAEAVSAKNKCILLRGMTSDLFYFPRGDALALFDELAAILFQ